MQQISCDLGRPAGGGVVSTDIASAVRGLRQLYPNIELWFALKVGPGLLDGSRAIFQRGSDSLDGFVIAKRTLHERKICTLWVDPSKRRQGLASDLMAEASEWLGTRFPLITVGEERLSELGKLFEYHSFVCTGAIEGIYRRHRKEFIFNGWL
ncbi:GNAT family N-acetyltransferase [Mesorhizobium sp. WSM3866]|uniref:GNAT family N-acetyltransferase n=1 Tax=Mesorhizobium sp. WSM3866 TaxID=422271 RepID=UPI00159708C3|nr:GNAT family N-acetyltransferase [Mesorhizobium sp. WSM3866]